MARIASPLFICVLMVSSAWPAELERRAQAGLDKLHGLAGELQEAAALLKAQVDKLDPNAVSPAPLAEAERVRRLAVEIKKLAKEARRLLKGAGARSAGAFGFVQIPPMRTKPNRKYVRPQEHDDPLMRDVEVDREAALMESIRNMRPNAAKIVSLAAEIADLLAEEIDDKRLREVEKKADRIADLAKEIKLALEGRF